ncbi:FAD-dependent oxidoreductase [Streptomyces sp. NPDC093250]|uniref:FAD-dependent oxidoreductase n=1 Tax=Streptomyces sp. NPDC093250 TaxID=3366036 RepID=UPI00381787D8
MADSVVVIGAGVVGLTTAVCLAERGVDVEVVSARDPAATTSAAAGAMWDPYLVRPAALVERWSRVGLDALTGLSDVEDSGVRLADGTQQSRTPCDLPAWAPLVGARACTPDELMPGFVTGWRYRAPVVDMPRYLAHLARRLRAAGGRMRRRHYDTLADALRAHPVPVVVNCTGAGARCFVPDPSVVPVRGQLVVVENPGIDDFFCDDTPGADDLVYIYPQGDTLVLGGTAERGSWDTEPDGDTARRIVGRCAAIDPRLAGARVVECRVGLRPARPEIRFEEERHGATTVVHSYGHGGGGVTLSWGAGGETADRVRRLLSLTP